MFEKRHPEYLKINLKGSNQFLQLVDVKVKGAKKRGGEIHRNNDINHERCRTVSTSILEIFREFKQLLFRYLQNRHHQRRRLNLEGVAQFFREKVAVIFKNDVISETLTSTPNYRQNSTIMLRSH